MARRKPSPRCAVCDQPWETIGGARLIATPSCHLLLQDGMTMFKTLPPGPTRIVRLRDNLRDLFLVLGGDRLWTEESMRRAEADAYAGFRPWFCQRCARHGLCPRCGAPRVRAPGGDRLDDLGRSWHSPWFFDAIARCQAGCDWPAPHVAEAAGSNPED